MLYKNKKIVTMWASVWTLFLNMSFQSSKCRSVLGSYLTRNMRNQPPNWTQQNERSEEECMTLIDWSVSQGPYSDSSLLGTCLAYRPLALGLLRHEAIRPSTPQSSSRRHRRPRVTSTILQEGQYGSSMIPRGLPIAGMAVAQKSLLPLCRWTWWTPDLERADYNNI